MLSIVHFEAAPRSLRSKLPPQPATDIDLPLDIHYGDDTDFVSHSRDFLNQIDTIVPHSLAEWFLAINISKTERPSTQRHTNQISEE